MLFFYFSFLTLGVSLISIILINEKNKNKTKKPDLLQVKISEFFQHLDAFNKKFDPFLTTTSHNDPVEPVQSENFNYPQNLQPEEILDHAGIQQNYSIVAPILNSGTDWRTQYEKLDSLFQEKSELLEKMDRALNNEIKNRNEFENLKSLLEDEIENGKEKRRQMQDELNNLKMENENLRDKLAQLRNEHSSKF